jgi:hypothetical protein
MEKTVNMPVISVLKKKLNNNKPSTIDSLGKSFFSFKIYFKFLCVSVCLFV